MSYEVNARVLVQYGDCIYDACILQKDTNGDEVLYFVHYPKYSSSWDEWVGLDRIFDINPETRIKQREANTKAQQEAARKKKAQKKRNASAIKERLKKQKMEEKEMEIELITKEEKFAIEMKFPMPMALKKILVDDKRNIEQGALWVELPRKVSVATIMEDFLNADGPQKRQADESTEQVIQGLLAYFDKAIPSLLYSSESSQYDSIVAAYPNTPLSTIYGGEHLLRLLVIAGALLHDILMAQHQIDSIQGTIAQLLKFLKSRRQNYFLPAYTAATIALGAVVFFGGIKLLRGKIYDAMIVKLTTEWYRVVLESLPDKSKMLDVGIGTGKALLNNRSLLVSKDISVDGVDYDKDYVVDCKANVDRSKMNEQIQVVHASIYDYETTTKYDAVYFSASLMIMPDPVEAIRHTLSFLRPNGHIFVTLTVQTKASWFIQTFKPLLKFLTTIDFGSVTYESDLLLTFQRAGLRILHERCLNGSTRSSTRSYRFFHLTRA